MTLSLRVFLLCMSLSRVPLAVTVFVLFAVNRLTVAAGVSLGVVLLMAASDVADGRLARRYGVVSQAGALADSYSDHMAVTILIVALGEARLLPLWFVIPTLVRDGVVDLLRSILLSRGIAVRSSWSGKLKGAAEMALLMTVLTYVCLSRTRPAFLLPFAIATVVGLQLVSLVEAVLATRRKLAIAAGLSTDVEPERI